MQIEYSAKMDADEEQKGAEMRKVKDRQVVADSAGVCRDSKQHLRFSAFLEQYKQGWTAPRYSSAGRATLTALEAANFLGQSLEELPLCLRC
ncbi:hypothetical protein Esi_0320_0003 [Ectocarpus siliculosus]|uniref:Uncharacterized protein n=1 Tax=Ectocarpus siliculosus TaxID=2880 RepID=D7FX82_ECTSI|nr:hypothetical protein Esi_0320_0003 [Ectocarpus siliculosus]|eukprot:CBJ49260.1 hypothetical protein Esi_0320_0003 [Ectocarpus siliculosus]